MTDPTHSSQKIPVNIEDEMQRAYLDYAMSVIVGRALPDVRDGLKPVHRRVLFAMHELGNDWNKPYKKSARVVGDVIGKYHPHGDVAVYDTIVRMAQDFSMRHMLVDGQGNFGSVDGDSPAAMRYTEVRMARLAHELLADLDKDTVDFGPNYDGSLTEPLVLPSKFPNLLVNGSSGIAVGMATNIPPHNLGEISDAVCMLIDRMLATLAGETVAELTTSELMRLVTGPDFPTGGIIHGRAGIRSAYESGRGSVVVRARTEVEKVREDREAIIVRELPYQVNKARLVEQIADLVRDKKLVGIADLRDESDREGMRVVIEVKRDAHPEVVLNQLFKHTPMQSTFGVNALALVDGRPETLSLRRMLDAFIDHRREVVTRRTLFELQKARGRAHILEGLAVALANIDRVIALIRAATSPAEAKEALIAELWQRGAVEEMLLRAMRARPELPDSAGQPLSTQFVDGGYRFSEEQATAILDMRLHRLTGLEQDKIRAEFEEILDLIVRLEEILGSPIRLLEVIREETVAIRDGFANKRRTEIREAAADLSIADLITEQEMVVTVSHTGYIKRQPTEDYRAQRRGGKGRIAAGVRDEDYIEQLFVASTHDTILCFTNRGRVFKLKVYDIPQSGRQARGKALVNLLALEEGEKVRQILPAPIPPAERNQWELLFATSRGLIKKTSLAAFANIRANGIRALDLMEGDDLIGVALLPVLPGEVLPPVEEEEGDEGNEAEEMVELETDSEVDGEEEESEDEADIGGEARPGRVLLFSRSGKAARFRTRQVRGTGRTSRGVRGMRLKGEDRVIALAVVQPGCDVLTITEHGYGKRTEEDRFPTKGRGGQGVIGMITSERNGGVVGALTVGRGEHVMLITDRGTMLRTDVESIRLTGRNTQGVRVLNVASDERVVAVTTLAEPPEDEKVGDVMVEEGEEAGGEDVGGEVQE